LYLDTVKKVWKIRTKEYKVLEDIPMKDLKWFKTEYKNVIKKNEDGKLTQVDALEFDEMWWKKLCEIGLHSTMDDVLESNCTEREFRDFMSELYNFLSNLSTIDAAKQSGLYDQGTETKDKKP
jgi:hypothetical protein